LSDDDLLAGSTPNGAEEDQLQAIAEAFATFDGFALKGDQKRQTDNPQIV